MEDSNLCPEERRAMVRRAVEQGIDETRASTIVDMTAKFADESMEL